MRARRPRSQDMSPPTLGGRIRYQREANKHGPPNGGQLQRASSSMRQVYAILLCLVVMSPAARGQERDRKAPLAPEARERVRNAVAAVGLISVRDPADGQLRP